MKYLFVAAFCLLSSPANAQYTAQEILTMASKSMSIRSSVQYQANCLYKFFDGDDTMAFSGAVQLLKDARDSIFGGYVRYQMFDTLYKLYDLHGIYAVNTKSRKIDRFDPHKGEYWAMTGNIRHNMVWEYFLEPEKLYKQAHGTAKLTLLADTMLSGIECYKVRLEYPDEEEFSDRNYTICVTKHDKVPILRYWHIKHQGNYQYSSIMVTNCRFNSLRPADFTIDAKHRKYKIDTFKREPPPELLSRGTTAPAIKGQHYQDNMTEKVIDFTGRVTLLDYWYMACFPCIQAIPAIERLHEKYKDRGLQVLGVNPVDIKRLDKMPSFLEYNAIKYPICMVAYEIPTAYNVTVYPTFYVVGRDGKVVFSTVGFNKDTTEKELAKAIEDAL